MTDLINKADLTVFLILLAAMVYGWRIGIVKNIVGLFSKIISFIVARAAVPYVALMVRATPVFDLLRDEVKSRLGLEDLLMQGIADSTQRTQADIINSLSVPDILKTSLLENNNNEIYNLLGVNDLANYISGYIANMILNVAIMLIIMLFLWTVIPMICKSITSLAELPIIKTVDKTFGTIFGFIQAMFIIWVITAVIFVMNVGGEYSAAMEEINNSYIASMFYESNIIKYMLMQIM